MPLAASRTAACPHAEGGSDLWSPVSDAAMRSDLVCAACALRSHHVCSQLGTLQVGCLPVVHGSALVSAGSSQASLNPSVCVMPGRSHQSCEVLMDGPNEATIAIFF